MGAILHLTDFSDAALNAYEHAIALARRLRYDLHVIHFHEKGLAIGTALRTLRPDLALSPATLQEHIQSVLGQYMEGYCAAFDTEGVALYTHIWTDAVVWRADEWLWRIPEARLIVVGTQGATGSLQRSLFGTNASRLIRHSLIPVLAIHPPNKYAPYQRALIPVDIQDPEGRQGIAFLADFLHRWEPPLSVTFLYVRERSSAETDEQIRSFSEWVQRFPALTQATWHVETGTPVREAIARFFEQMQADLLIMGTHARTGLERLLEGSLTESIAKHLQYPLLAFPLRSAIA